MANYTFCPTNPAVGRATVPPAHYVPAPLRAEIRRKCRKRRASQTFLSDHAGAFQIALVGDEYDGSRTAGGRQVLVANACENVGGFLVRSAVGDGVHDDVAMHVVLLPHFQILTGTHRPPAMEPGHRVTDHRVTTTDPVCDPVFLNCFQFN